MMCVNYAKMNYFSKTTKELTFEDLFKSMCFHFLKCLHVFPFFLSSDTLEPILYIEMTRAVDSALNQGIDALLGVLVIDKDVDEAFQNISVNIGGARLYLSTKGIIQSEPEMNPEIVRVIQLDSELIQGTPQAQPVQSV